MTQLAFLNGRFLPEAELTISIHDVGFVQGVTVAERVRTFGGRLFKLAEHLDRLRRSLAIVDIAIVFPTQQLSAAAEELVQQNRTELPSASDLSLVVFVTAGCGEPQVAMHTMVLPFAEMHNKFQRGQRLVIPEIRQVPTTCWPAELKCRSRMHYYLADKQAVRSDPESRALLLDQQGFVSEASTANVVAYIPEEGLVSPPTEKILPGISIATLEEIAASMTIPFVYRDITPHQLRAANEVYLCSTSPCIVPAVAIDGHAIGTGTPGPMHGQLIAAWSERVGVDIMEQAQRMSG
ncbi:MAG: aminotransferase class IV [Pirellulaceae bacterium]|nr:aminotransferase class IV [Planctomycetales bacterium]